MADWNLASVFSGKWKQTERVTGEIDALETEGLNGVLEGFCGVHSEIFHVLLHYFVEGFLRYRTYCLRWAHLVSRQIGSHEERMVFWNERVMSDVGNQSVLNLKNVCNRILALFS